MSSALHGMGDLADIHNTIVHRRKKMEDSAVVPYVVSGRLQLDFIDIGD
jgi:hypothetical protein